MRKLKITQSQLKFIEESIKKENKQLVESALAPISEPRVPNITEFGTAIATAINEIFVNNNATVELPDSLTSLGVNTNDLKHKLLADKIIQVGEENGESQFKFKGKGFLNWCEKYLNDIVNPTQQSEILQQEKPLEEDSNYDGNHWNNDDSSAPWNDKGDDNEEKPYDYPFEKNDRVKILATGSKLGVEYISLCKIGNDLILFGHEMMPEFENMDLGQVIYNIIFGYIGTESKPNWDASVMDFASGETNFIVVTQENQAEVIKAVDMLFGEVGKLPAAFKSFFFQNNEQELDETTTTGTVGGSYETPAAWAKNGHKPKHGAKPMYDGGTFVKPEMIDGFDTIMENKLSFKTLNEALVFKKDESKGKIILTSDLETQAQKNSETFNIKKFVEVYGFKWDREFNAYSTSIENFDRAKELSSTLKKCQQVLTELSELENFIEANAGVDKDEFKQKLQSFYAELESDLNENSYIEMALEFIKFRHNLKNKFNKNYSFNNLMLIFIQRPTATVFAGINEWNEVGRKIKKGAKAIYILAPKMYKAKDENGQVELDDNGNEISRVGGYRKVNIFDIKDTYAADGSEDPKETEYEWQPSNDPEERAEQISELLSQVIREDGIELTSSKSNNGEGGFSANGRINITDDTHGVRLLSVLIHEYAHELLHWEKSAFGKQKRADLDSRTKEIQAEGVAYAVLRFYGYETDETKSYLQGWRTLPDGTKLSIMDHTQIMIGVCEYITNKVSTKMKRAMAKH